MVVRRDGPILETIDLRSIRPKVGGLEVIAWIEYSHCEIIKSKLYTDSESIRLLRMLRAQQDILNLKDVMTDDRIVCAASLKEERIEDETWGAVDIAQKGSFSLVAVFNNGRLNQLQTDHLIEVFEYLQMLNHLRVKVVWEFWGGYPAVRSIFKSYYRRQLDQ